MQLGDTFPRDSRGRARRALRPHPGDLRTFWHALRAFSDLTVSGVSTQTHTHTHRVLDMGSLAMTVVIAHSNNKATKSSERKLDVLGDNVSIAYYSIVYIRLVVEKE